MPQASEKIEVKILEFLKKNQNERGCTLNEIYSGIGFSGMGLWSLVGHPVVLDALESLINEGAVEAKKIKQPFLDETYYRVRTPKPGEI